MRYFPKITSITLALVIATVGNSSGAFAGNGFSDTISIFQEISSEFQELKNANQEVISLLEQAQKNFDDKKYDLALNNMNKVLEIDPNLSRVYFMRGVIEDAMDMRNEALADFTKVIDMGRQGIIFYLAYGQRGVLYGKLGKYELAVQDLSKMIELKPDSTLPYPYRGYAYFRLGKHTEALADYNKAFQINPKGSKDLYHARAEVLLYFIDYDQAWQNVHEAEKKGLKLGEKFIQKLQEVSGRRE